ncbi:hypothetical protein ACFL0Q_09205, partial [Thermodesulfobacteriota bacterium]
MIDGHRETIRTSSKAFTERISQDFYDKYGKGVPNRDIKDALNTIKGKAVNDGPLRKVHVRLAEAEDVIYIDLGDKAFNIITVTSDGWSVGPNSQIYFLRPPGMGELPYPVEGCSVGSLRKYTNLENPADFYLLVGFLIGCFHPSGPYPVLEVIGEQGSAKSTLIRVVKRLVDPSAVELRSLPRSLRDLSIQAANSWVLSYDNVSYIPDEISDALCRLSTGGGFATRTLYSDREETLFDAKRPLMLDGINASVSREDLTDRVIRLSLATIPEEDRRTEKEFWEEFDAERPAIIGAILDTVSCALKGYRNVKLPYVPRMADFAIWVTAAEPALGWESGTFLQEYSRNRSEASSQIVEADLVLSTVVNFMKDYDEWKGTPTQLLELLGDRIGEDAKRSRWWPKSPQHLSRALNRGATALRQEGVDAKLEKGEKRLWTLRSLREEAASRQGYHKVRINVINLADRFVSREEFAD